MKFEQVLSFQRSEQSVSFYTHQKHVQFFNLEVFFSKALKSCRRISSLRYTFTLAYCQQKIYNIYCVFGCLFLFCIINNITILFHFSWVKYKKKRLLEWETLFSIVWVAKREIWISFCNKKLYICTLLSIKSQRQVVFILVLNKRYLSYEQKEQKTK